MRRPLALLDFLYIFRPFLCQLKNTVLTIIQPLLLGNTTTIIYITLIMGLVKQILLKYLLM